MELSQIGTDLPHSLNKPGIIQAATEQIPVTDEGPIRQALPDELEAIDISAIQISAKAGDVDFKPGLNSVRLLQTIS